MSSLWSQWNTSELSLDCVHKCHALLERTKTIADSIIMLNMRVWFALSVTSCLILDGRFNNRKTLRPMCWFTFKMATRVQSMELLFHLGKNQHNMFVGEICMIFTFIVFDVKRVLLVWYNYCVFIELKMTNHSNNLAIVVIYTVCVVYIYKQII